MTGVARKDWFYFKMVIIQPENINDTKAYKKTKVIFQRMKITKWLLFYQ